MSSYHLSKSKILSGLQCPKRLYLEVHQPELLEESPETAVRFSSGNRVGEVARDLFPGGILIPYDDSLSSVVKHTKKVLDQNSKTTVFEATFNHRKVLIRADIFIQKNKNHRLIEVKASTGVKEYHLNDCAVQAWVIEGAGYHLSQIELAHVDTSFVYKGGGDYNGLLHYENVTNDVNKLKKNVPKWVKQFQKVLSGDLPTIEVGKHCKDPYECSFMGHCSPEGPDYPVDILPYGRSVVDELLSEGIEDVRDIPENRLNNERHERVRRVTVSGTPELDQELVDYIKSQEYPRFYLDFETFGSPVPIWIGTMPYQNHLPFQWSCHIERKPGAVEHSEFLDLSGDNPMKELAVKLIETLGDKGLVFVYSNFENSVLNRLGEFYPELIPELEKIAERLVDLLPLARQHYYHPDMMGSWSIKDVLPTVVPELNYNDLDGVHDGGEAQLAYIEAIQTESSSERRRLIERQMLEYCKLDTLALVKLVEFFQKPSNS
jgi:hypothetical protein